MSDENIVVCPNCGGVNISIKKIKDSNSNDINHYLCMFCGYYTQDNFTLEVRKDFDQSIPRLYKDLCKISKDTDLSWYPVILDYNKLALLFPDGTSVNDWGWTVAPYEVIPKEDRSKYPIPGKKDEYQTHRVSLKHGRHFDKNGFIQASMFLNFLIKDTN